jgi:amphi-Trp domain-containing protein
MSDVNVSRTETLTRQQAADMLSALATALSEGAGVEVQLGASTLRVHVPDQVRYEVEVEVDGDEVELEVELTWSTATQARVTAPAAAAKPVTAAKPAAATEPDPGSAGSPRTRTAKNVAAARSRRSDGRA